MKEVKDKTILKVSLRACASISQLRIFVDILKVRHTLDPSFKCTVAASYLKNL